MELDDIMRDLLRLAEEKRLGLPTRFRVDFADGKQIDLPFDLVRTISSTGPSTTRQAAHDGDRAPKTIPEAIQHALFLRDCRLTSGKLVADVQEQWGHRGWDDASIGVEASRMVSSGTLTHEKEDPQDGRGKGYGLITWRPSEG